MDAADEESDWDVVLVLLEGEPSQKKDGSLELITTTLDRVKAVSSWELPALAHSRVLLDKSGELAVAVETAGRLTRAELAELYDNYLNDFYRSLKAWRRGRELGARILSGRSLWWLGDLLQGLEGKRAPYTEYWAGRLGELEPLIVEVARRADPRKQQELQAAVEQIATARGFRDVYDAWNGDIDRVMTSGRMRPALVVDVGLKLALVAALAFGTLSDLERFEGKAFGARLIAYPLATLIVPAAWWLGSRRPPYPYAADILITLPFLIDTLGNVFDLYDTIEWWDDANHFVNWALLTAAFGQFLLRLPLGVLNTFALAVGFGAVTAILWEFGEYFAFIRDSPELATAYTDTLGDLALGLTGSTVAAFVTAGFRHRL